jgi:hypothetical protein
MRDNISFNFIYIFYAHLNIKAEIKIKNSMYGIQLAINISNLLSYFIILGNGGLGGKGYLFKFKFLFNFIFF